MESLIDIINDATEMAKKYYQGMFFIIRNETGYEAGFGSVHDPMVRCYPGVSIEDALQNALKNKKRQKR